ncbi:MAG: aminotransferase class I/II-fold pyridoxal phosphate-dependent enzyme [Nostoc sp. EfeVER01]|uniref:aminotransferase class I/II-fold pyridoxal phosphate-dependent enzyme n=1 Tax=unclassified Nostoc TaxID=2593658 RepID=UPI002AD50654|nr:MULTISPECIES: aminotransferase class I/II-fold pyridoxal phosphate-dependent enzyme [unclassified Nostoc]MDZ7944809.1 aminotransferase class I/II-fold pyridoxal phosphate-dependent enzyme [Nostoc sp. EfeVER01]MDZ7994098.1 aminotransferase class I/II-fold pyridoxal phosphate-dependent enzyme [Nostoc sp. EspVER01]
MLNQNKTPLLDALKANAARPHAPFYTPGHKLGEGISQPLADLLGKAVFRADLTELADLDNLFAPQGVIQEAQQLAAEAFGASQTWFLVNGSTCGIEAAILATCGTGDKIILPRNVHSSAIAGLILSGAIPIFLNPEYDPVLDIAHSITPNAVQSALQQHPDAKAVLVVYPTYYGVCGDLSAIANITHQYNIPLLVDEAHGAHFAFHPELPTSALAAGADLTVQSIHKILGAMTQASMLHIHGDRIDGDRISKALQLVQSTSPSYLLLASLDAARQQMALHGKMLMSRTLQLAEEARTRISQISGLSVLEMPHLGGSPGFVTLDKTRLTVTVSGLGLTGFEADEILDEKLGVTAEFASLQHLTFIISLGNTPADIEQLVQGFTTIAKEYRRSNLTVKNQVWLNLDRTLDYALQLSPREAFFAVSEILPLTQTNKRICAEIVCPYPPGIPVLMPGEVITKSVLEYLQQIQARGGFISGCNDISLKTLKVVK